MRHAAYASILFTIATLSAAAAQEAPYSQTLDEQMQRMQQGKRAVPDYGQPSSSDAPYRPMVKRQQPGAEWPASPALATRDERPTAPASTNEPIDSTGGGAIPALPLERRASNGVDYVTGGIGDEELAQLKEVEANYNVRFLMTGSDGSYVSDVMLRVQDMNGKDIVSADGAGPYFFTRLPPGDYYLEANPKYDNAIRKIKFSVPAQGVSRQHIRFNE